MKNCFLSTIIISVIKWGYKNDRRNTNFINGILSAFNIIFISLNTDYIEYSDAARNVIKEIIRSIRSFSIYFRFTEKCLHKIFSILNIVQSFLYNRIVQSSENKSNAKLILSKTNKNI